ncbi:hypothetical protein GOP47_0029609 [Adiantum capillus-veneris]|nr:hypothetical protein GOP47_0029609 [Adiantum capillus-veneris]
MFREPILPARVICRVLISKKTQTDGSCLRDPFCEQRRMYEALRKQVQKQEETSLDVLDQPGITLNLTSFSSLLRTCTRHKTLADGKRVHHLIHQAGLQTNPFLSSLLIRMYAQCGALDPACSVFSETLARDTYTWNIMIGSFLCHGESRNALLQFNHMQHEGYPPDECTFVSVLSACSKEKSLGNGKQIHSLAMANGVDTNPRVGTSLLEMYKKCGSLDDVKTMFSRIEDRDAFVWSVLISAYMQHGVSSMALPLFQQMLQESTLPDKVIFVSVLASCDSESLLNEGKRLHATIIGSKCELDNYLTTATINMYGRCGNMAQARCLFKELPNRDVITWNSMIAMCVKQALSNEAFQLYEQMLLEGVKPDEATFVGLLDACSSPKFLPEGMKLHDDIKARGFDSHILVSTNLLNMYSRCGSLQQARDVFDVMRRCDVVAWNAMINACAQHQQGTEALKLFRDMQLDGVMLDMVTFLNVLQACSVETKLVDGNRIHDLIVINGLDSDVVVATALVNMYGKCGSLGDAWKLFSIIPQRTSVSWNAMIAGYAQDGCVERVLFLFKQMQLEGKMPNEVTFITLLSLHESGLALNVGRRLHSCLRSFRFANTVAVGSALISMYGKYGSVDDAMTVFRGLEEKNAVSWTAIMSAYVQQNKYIVCSSLFEEMQQQGITPDKLSFVVMIDAVAEAEMLSNGRLLHTCVASEDLGLIIDVANALICMYGKLCSLEDALSTFYGLRLGNKQSFVNILSSCANLLALSDGTIVHSLLVADGILLDRLLGNNLINLYGKCGCVDDARRVFDRMNCRDTISWTSMIVTYAEHGHGKEALRLFYQMQHENVPPNDVTFLGVLSACNHAGLVDDGCRHLISMDRDYGITPSEDHYNCIVDLLSRSGRLEEAEDMISKIPSDSRGVAWTTLLGACVCRGDAVRGKRAAGNIFEVDPKNPVPYVILHNTFAIADHG